MKEVDHDKVRRVGRGLLLAAIVAILLYTFAPRTGSQSAPLRPPDARKAMPAFTMPLIAGGSWTLAEHKGKVLFVNFWATWCPPCRAETPALVNLANRYRARGFEVVGIAMDDDPDSAVPPFLKRYNVTYPILVPTAESALAGGIESLPTSFLLDKQGRVARTYVGAVDEDDIEADIHRLLAE